MNASDVIDFYFQMDALDITIWLDGGWGVDALLGEQTRAHADLDIAVQEADYATARGFLERSGFRDLQRDDTRPRNFVLADANGREIDFHVIVLDADGNGVHGPRENGQIYPAEALRWTGRVGGVPVRCVSPAFQIASHTGYALSQKGYRDVRALAERFGLDLPSQLQNQA